MTHNAYSSARWTQPSLAPLLTLMTRRDFNRVNDRSKCCLPIMINALVILSPSLLQRQVGFLRPGLHRRRRRIRFQCAPHDLPPNRIIKQRVNLIRRRSASFTFLAPVFPLRR